MFSVKIQGAQLVAKMLQDFGGKHANGALRKGSRAGCKLIQKDAKRRIPKTPRRDRQGNITKGMLFKAVKVRAIKRNRKGWVGCMVQIGQGDFKGDTFFGAFYEYGTNKMEGRHPLKEAADACEAAAVAVCQGVIFQELKKAGLE